MKLHHFSYITPSKLQHILCHIVLGVTCKRPHSKIPDASLTILKCLRTNCLNVIAINAYETDSSNIVFSFGKDCMPFI